LKESKRSDCLGRRGEEKEEGGRKEEEGGRRKEE
jgi:hypothetical protein